MDFFNKTFRGDRTVWIIFILLCIISLVEIFSATSTIVYKQGNQWGPIIRHALFLLTGFCGVMFLQRVPTRFFSLSIPILIISWFFLILTLFMGEEVNGAQRYLGFGAFSFQPSEIAKIAAIGAVAFFLSKTNKENESIMFKVIITGVLVTCGLIILDNLSTGILLFCVCFLMMIIGQVSWKRIGKITLSGILIGSILFMALSFIPEDTIKDKLPDRFGTWKSRIDKFLDSSSPNGVGGNIEEYNISENFQISHAKIAIANGGIIGLPGSGTERDFLPQAYSDFIFAIILEEMGLIGGIVVMLLYFWLMIRVGMLARKCDKFFPKYLLLGSGLILTIQALINMGVAVDLFPITGQPLPLISRGGTSTIITCAYFGIILACSNFKEKEHENVDEDIANIAYD